MAAEIVRQEAFEDVQLTVIEHEGEEWFTAEDIGKALGFAEPSKSVRKIYERNKDEFFGISSRVRLTRERRSREYRVFNLQAVYKISFFADTPRAKAVRHWASFMLTQGMERLRLRVRELEAAAPPQLPAPEGAWAEEMARLQARDARRREEIITLMNALHLKRKKHLERILADPHLKKVFYENIPEDLRGALALPAPEPQYAPGSDREPIPVRRGLLKTLRSCLSSHNPRNCRAGAAIVQALLDGQEPPDVLELYKLPQGLLKRDNYRKTKVWKVLAEHDDAEAEQAREEIKAIAFYTQAAMNFYEDMHQGFSMFDREVWNIARESADNELPRM